MDFTVNFMNRASAVLKEAFLLKKYKAMPVALAIIVGIFMLPLILASLISAFFVYVLGYLFSVVSLPVQSLHKLLKEEGQAVKHGTQVIIYLASWGFVFSAYAALSFFLVTLTVLYSLFSIFTYLWTLGGFKFHLFTKEEDIAIEVNGKYNALVPVIFIALMGTLLLIVPMFKTITTLIDFGESVKVTGKMLTELFKLEMHKTDTLRLVISAVYSAIFFAPGPKKIAK